MKKKERVAPKEGKSYLTTKQLARRWAYDHQSLINMRSQERGPDYFKFNGGEVRYSLEDVEKWESDSRNKITPKPHHD